MNKQNLSQEIPLKFMEESGKLSFMALGLMIVMASLNKENGEVTYNDIARMSSSVETIPDIFESLLDLEEEGYIDIITSKTKRIEDMVISLKKFNDRYL